MRARWVPGWVVAVMAVVVGAGLDAAGGLGAMSSPVFAQGKSDEARGGKEKGDKDRGDKDRGDKDRGGKDRGGKPNKSEKSGGSIDLVFSSQSRSLIVDFYSGEAKAGRCPPGLAKKGNGCQPPGQARQWAKGKALGADIRVHGLPGDLRVRLPLPPAGHEYVQLGRDILLIAVGTRIVVDAVENIFGG